MKQFLIIVLATLGIYCHGQISGHNGAPKYVPETGRLLILGQDLGAVGGLDGYTDGYIDNNDQTPAGVTTYTGLNGLGGLRNKANWGSGDVHGSAYLEDETFNNSTIALGLFITGSEGSIASGSMDGSIRSLAQWVIQADRPVFLRIGYEFDGPWNGFNPSTFISAWKRIVHIFDEEEVRNVAYVWQSAGINTANIDRWYPGDEYVNWMGYSHFDITNPGQSIRNFAAERNKPIMIAEAAPRKDLKTENGENLWNDWYQPLFDKIGETELIKALAYINVNWDIQSMWQGQGWGDSRVEVNPYIQQEWLVRTNSDEWLKASENLFEYLKYQFWNDSIATKIVASPPLQIKSMSDHLLVQIEGKELHLIFANAVTQVKVYDLQGRSIYEHRGSGDVRLENANLFNQTIIVSWQYDGRPQSAKFFLDTDQ